MRRSHLWSCLFAGPALAYALSGPAAAEPVTVVTSIKPVHSLVAAVMEGAGSPHLLVRGGASPHSYSLKPSDAAALEEAKVVVWVGEGLESFLTSPLATLAKDARVVELADAPGLTRLAYRAGGPWEEDDHDHGHEDEHGHAEDHGHEQEHDHAEEHHEDEDHDAHGHGEIDMHLWLDPDNAKAMVAAIAEALSAADPDNGDLYAANQRTLAQRLDQLAAEVAHDLAPVKDKPFVVFHDAFQYLDTRFDLNNVGSITVDPEHKPGAARLREIRAKIAELGARCVFAEPQYESRLLDIAVEGTEAKIGLLDPLGADLPDGPELYFELLRRNAAALKDCLGETS